jgi:hypothetical protein
MESELFLLDNFIILTVQLPKILQMNLSNKSSLQNVYLFLLILLKKRRLPFSVKRVFIAYRYHHNNLLLFCQYD